MIILEKDGLQMEVCTDVQASAFEKNGYVRVKAESVSEPVLETAKETEPQPEVEEQPKRRRRRVASKAE